MSKVEMIEATGVQCAVGFVPEAAHNAALARSGGSPPVFNGLLVSYDPDHAQNLMITINIVGLGIVWATLDQEKLESIADLLIAQSPAPAGETLQ